MEGEQGYGELDETRVRMVAEPPSVPAARHFVDAVLTDWGREALVEDIGLCVTELSTNATLHSGTQFFEIELQRQPDSVRVAVLDRGETSVDSLVAKSAYADAVMHDLSTGHPGTTGRGMFIVSALARSWGIDELAGGKRVWAELSEVGSLDTRPPEVTRLEAPARAAGLEELDVVRLVGCPARLLLAHDDNLDEIIRELQLIGANLEDPQLQRLADLLAGHVARHAVNWDSARIQALKAVRHGDERTDITVLAPRDVMSDIRLLRTLVREAEALSRAGRLMTLPAAPEIQDLRDWLEAEFREQTEKGREPVAYADWLSRSGD